MKPEDLDICKWLAPLLIGGSLVLVLPLPMYLKWASTDGRIAWVPSKPDDPGAKPYRSRTGAAPGRGNS
jgi:hypothetical protein